MSVRYGTLVDGVGLAETSPEGVARRAIARAPRVRALLRGQRTDGGFGLDAYRKWTGGFWRLVALSELAVPRALAVLRAAGRLRLTPAARRSLVSAAG